MSLELLQHHKDHWLLLTEQHWSIKNKYFVNVILFPTALTNITQVQLGKKAKFSSNPVQQLSVFKKCYRLRTRLTVSLVMLMNLMFSPVNLFP